MKRDKQIENEQILRFVVASQRVNTGTAPFCPRT